jgi:glycosyltransferase involved in cell wall biosynthesis
MTSPLVSVALPVRNGAGDLPKAIETILTQTFTDFELIVINDGSTDGTAAVLDAIRDPRLHVVHQENAGLSRALNRGIALARGRYIARIDHDDLAKPTRIEKQVAFMEANPGYALLGTWAEIWAGDEPSGRAHDFPADDAALRFELLFHNPFVQSSVLIRKSALDAVGGYSTDPARQPPEDYELWSRLARRYKVANLPERLTIYREVPNSQSRVGPNPFQQKLVVISAENLAAAVGAPKPDRNHWDMPALIHRAYHRVSKRPDIDAMCRVIEFAGAAIEDTAPGSNLSQRVGTWIENLRHALHNYRMYQLIHASVPKLDRSDLERAPPLASVILAVRNGGIDLPRAINSILTQTFTDLELIIVNDGSTDGTAAVLDKIDDPRVRVVHQENKGCAAAANTGIALARGRYIARIDHDDLAKPTRIEKQVAFMEANPDYALLGTWAEIWVGDEPSGRAHDFPADDAALRFELLFHNPFVQSSVLIRKSALDAVGGYSTDPARQPPEDYELWSRLARHHKVANLPERLTIYREVPNSQSRTGSNPFQQKLVVIAAENLAAAVGAPKPDRNHWDIAALVHGAYQRASPHPDIESMCRVVQEVGARISANAPGSDVPTRVTSWIKTLHHQNNNRRKLKIQNFFGRLWPFVHFIWRYSEVRQIIYFAWRYSGLRRLRQTLRALKS